MKQEIQGDCFVCVSVCVHTYSTISFVVFECFISVLYGLLLLLLCCVNRVTVKKDIEAVLMSRIYLDAHGRG